MGACDGRTQACFWTLIPYLPFLLGLSFIAERCLQPVVCLWPACDSGVHFRRCRVGSCRHRLCAPTRLLVNRAALPSLWYRGDNFTFCGFWPGITFCVVVMYRLVLSTEERGGLFRCTHCAIIHMAGAQLVHGRLLVCVAFFWICLWQRKWQ